MHYFILPFNDESFWNVLFQGINRQKFASDCVGAILRELRMAASDKQ